MFVETVHAAARSAADDLAVERRDKDVLDKRVLGREPAYGVYRRRIDPPPLKVEIVANMKAQSLPDDHVVSHLPKGNDRVLAAFHRDRRTGPPRRTDDFARRFFQSDLDELV